MLSVTTISGTEESVQVQDTRYLQYTHTTIPCQGTMPCKRPATLPYRGKVASFPSCVLMEQGKGDSLHLAINTEKREDRRGMNVRERGGKPNRTEREEKEKK